MRCGFDVLDPLTVEARAQSDLDARLTVLCVLVRDYGWMAPWLLRRIHNQLAMDDGVAAWHLVGQEQDSAHGYFLELEELFAA